MKRYIAAIFAGATIGVGAAAAPLAQVEFFDGGAYVASSPDESLRMIFELGGIRLFENLSITSAGSFTASSDDNFEEFVELLTNAQDDALVFDITPPDGATQVAIKKKASKATKKKSGAGSEVSFFGTDFQGASVTEIDLAITQLSFTTSVIESTDPLVQPQYRIDYDLTGMLSVEGVSIPEPATLALVGLGFIAGFGLRRRNFPDGR